MPDYKNAKIYKIVSNVTDDVYIGSTCSPLSQRLSEHRKQYKRYLNGKFHYMTSFKILETNDYSIVLIEDFPCERKEQILARERLFIEEYNNCINKHIPTRTQKEYRQDNKEKISQQLKEYYERHKEEKQEYDKKYQEQHKEMISEQKKIKYICGCGSEIRKSDKTKHERTKKHQAFIQQQE